MKVKSKYIHICSKGVSNIKSRNVLRKLFYVHDWDPNTAVPPHHGQSPFVTSFVEGHVCVCSCIDVVVR